MLEILLCIIGFCIAIIVEIGAIIIVAAITVGLINKFEHWRHRKKNNK